MGGSRADLLYSQRSLVSAFVAAIEFLHMLISEQGVSIKLGRKLVPLL
jgi:hypothetical protein